MKTLDLNKVEYYKKNSFNFDIGKYFNQSIELFSNNWQHFVLYSLISGIIFFISYFTFIGALLITYPLLMGFLIGAEKADNKISLQLGDFFDGFKNIGTYFLFTLSIILIYIIVLTPFFIFSLLPLAFDNADNPNVGLILGSSLLLMLLMCVVIIFLFIFQIMMFFAPYFIHYGNMGVKESMSTSYAVVRKNFWWILLITILIGAISSVGVFACYIGALISVPFAYIFVYFLLKDMLLTDDSQQSEIDLLGTNQE